MSNPGLTPAVFNLICPDCNGQGRAFDAEYEDWMICSTCKGAGLRAPVAPTSSPAPDPPAPNPEPIFLEYYSHEKTRCYKILLPFSKYGSEKLVLCREEEGKQKARELARKRVLERVDEVLPAPDPAQAPAAGPAEQAVIDAALEINRAWRANERIGDSFLARIYSAAEALEQERKAPALPKGEAPTKGEA